MAARFAYVRYLVSSSFWFLPGLMTVAAIGLSFLTLWMDRSGVLDWMVRKRLLARLDPDGAREILSTTAGSMITVTSLVFSLTLVTLTLATRQLGPRLLRTFMQDRINQFVLGAFTATFAYHLLILRSVRSGDEDGFVPAFSVLVAILLALAALGLLILFIHHIASRIQADTMIAHVGRELDEGIALAFPVDDEEQPPPDPAARAGSGAAMLCASDNGYIQAIDHHKLVALAAKRDIVIRLERRPGQYVIAEGCVGWAWPGERMDDAALGEIWRSMTLGSTRTPTQDIEYSMRALVEIALRALSPALNDPNTAIACVDRLGASLALVLRRGRARSAWMDGDGIPRLFVQPVTFEEMLEVSFEELRDSAAGSPSVVLRMAEILAELARFPRRRGQSEAIRRQARRIATAGRKALRDEAHIDAVAGRAAHVEAVLDGQATARP